MLLALLLSAAPLLAAPPPLPASGTSAAKITYTYHGPGGDGQYSAAEIARFVREDPSGEHLVWAEGWTDWRSWKQVPDIARTVASPPVVLYSYADASGTIQSLSPADVAKKVAAQPDAKHLVWKDGLTNWMDPKSVPEISSLLPASSGGTSGTPVVVTPPTPGGPPAGTLPSGTLPSGTLPSGTLPPGSQSRTAGPPQLPGPPSGNATGGTPPPYPGSTSGGSTIGGSAPPTSIGGSAPPTTIGGSAPPPPPTTIGGAAPMEGSPAPMAPGMDGHGMDGHHGMEGKSDGCCAMKPGERFTPIAQAFVTFSAEDFTQATAGEDTADPAFSLSLAQLGGRFALSEHFEGALAVELSQDPSLARYDLTNVAVVDAAVEPSVEVPLQGDTWSVVPAEATVTARFGKSVQNVVRLGVQRPVFGVADVVVPGSEWYLGGTNAWETPEERMELLPRYDVGASFRTGKAEKFTLDLGVFNGGTIAAVEDNVGKEVEARVLVTPASPVTIGLSGRAERTGPASTGSDKAGNLSLNARYKGVRLLGEATLGQVAEAGVESGYLAYSVIGAGDIPIDAIGLDHVTILGRFLAHDPVTGNDYPDAFWSPAFGALAYWKVDGDTTVGAGLTYEAAIPENELEPITHGLFAQGFFRY